MNIFLAAAGAGSVLLGLAHSIIGERLVLRPLMRWSGGGERGEVILSMQQRRVLRASWHLVSVLGFGLAALLLAASASGGFGHARTVLAATFTAAAIYWLPATRGRHPAWVVLLVIAALTALG